MEYLFINSINFSFIFEFGSIVPRSRAPLQLQQLQLQLKVEGMWKSEIEIWSCLDAFLTVLPLCFAHAE